MHILISSSKSRIFSIGDQQIQGKIHLHLHVQPLLSNMLSYIFYGGPSNISVKVIIIISLRSVTIGGKICI